MENGAIENEDSQDEYVTTGDAVQVEDYLNGGDEE